MGAGALTAAVGTETVAGWQRAAMTTQQRRDALMTAGLDAYAAEVDAPFGIADSIGRLVESAGQGDPWADNPDESFDASCRVFDLWHTGAVSKATAAVETAAASLADGE